MKMKSSKRVLVIGICVFLLFVIAISLNQIRIFNEIELLKEIFIVPEKHAPDSFRIVADVVTIDQLRGELTIRMEIVPPDAQIDQRNLPLEDITLQIDSLSGREEFLFEKGTPLNPFTVNARMIGKPSNYPLDVYSTYLTLYLSTQTIGVQEIISTESKPLVVETTAEIPGYSIVIANLIEEILEIEAEAEIEEDEIGEAGESEGDTLAIALNDTKLDDNDALVGLFIEVGHSRAVLSFIIFLMAMQWVLAFVAFIITLVTITRKRSVKITDFSWMGALLFAQIALRNAMPGTPPVGTLGDSMSFFWVLGIITISMLVLVGTWIFQGE
jgi:hypothetical protein